jgi:hypothetical protein
MHSLALRTVADLMPAARTIGHDQGIGLISHGRQQTEFSHLHRHLYVAGFIAEGSRHATATAFDQLGRRARNQSDDIQDRTHGVKGFLMAVAVQKDRLCGGPQARLEIFELAGGRFAGQELFQSSAWRLTVWAASPRPRVSASSRRVSRHEGSSPTMAMPWAAKGIPLRQAAPGRQPQPLRSPRRASTGMRCAGSAGARRLAQARIVRAAGATSLSFSVWPWLLFVVVQELDLHAGHVHAGRAVALAALAAHAQLHGFLAPVASGPRAPAGLTAPGAACWRGPRVRCCSSRVTR